MYNFVVGSDFFFFFFFFLFFFFFFFFGLLYIYLYLPMLCHEINSIVVCLDFKLRYCSSYYYYFFKYF